MTLPAAMVWELQGGVGNDLNSGLFKLGGSGTDFSQQAAPQLDLSDWKAVAGKLDRAYSVASGAQLTSEKIDNGIQFSAGSNVLTGFYHVEGQGSDGDGSYLLLDRAWASAGTTNGTGRLGGCLAGFEVMDSILIAGNIVYVKAGTYTLAGSITFANGNSTTQSRIIGYSSARGDNPTGLSRPLIAQGGNGWSLGTYNLMKNVRGTTTHSNGCYMSTYCVGINLDWENTGALSTDRAFRVDGVRLIDCVGKSANGRAFGATYACKFMQCRAHHSNEGIAILSNGSHTHIIDCVIDHNTAAGIVADGMSFLAIEHNTIDANDKGFDSNASYGDVFRNNIFSNNVTYGITLDSEYKNNHFDYNLFHNNGTDRNNAEIGDNDKSYDPLYNDAANGDYSRPTATEDGFGMRLGVG